VAQKVREYSDGVGIQALKKVYSGPKILLLTIPRRINFRVHSAHYQNIVLYRVKAYQ